MILFLRISARWEPSDDVMWQVKPDQSDPESALPTLAVRRRCASLTSYVASCPERRGVLLSFHKVRFSKAMFYNGSFRQMCYDMSAEYLRRLIAYDRSMLPGIPTVEWPLCDPSQVPCANKID